MGFAAGVLAAGYFGAAGEGARSPGPLAEISMMGGGVAWAGLLVLSVAGAAALAVIAGWIPTMVATRQDPADILRNE